MTIELKHILLIIALLLLFANRLLQKKPFFEKNGNIIRIVVFLVLISALVAEFLKSKSYMIFFVAGLGVLAIGWIVYDMNRKEDENKDNSEKKDN
jgi:hypothetical protein